MRGSVRYRTWRRFALRGLRPSDGQLSILPPYRPAVCSRDEQPASMFFLHNLERSVTLHPSYFGRNMHDLVTTKLVKDVEGTCAGDYYIIAIMDTFDVSEGRILPGSGLAG